MTLVSRDGAFGGPLRVALNQATELQSRGHSVHLAAGWRGPGPAPGTLEGVPVRLFRAYSVVSRLGFSGLVSPGLARWLRRNVDSYDVVHVHAGRDLISLTSMSISWMKHARFVTQTHGMIGRDERLVARALDRLLTRRLLNAASCRFVLTGQEQTELATLLGEDRLERLPNGVPESAEVTRRTEADQVLFCARLHPRKRPLAFVQVAANLRDRGVRASFSLVGPDEGELTSVRRAIEDERLQDVVTYEGALDYADVLNRMREAAVYVLPSVNEPFPMTLLEALSLGLPCVCTDSSGIADTLRETRSALVTDGSVSGMSDAVELLLSNPELRLELAVRARRVVRDVFSMQAVATQLELAYNRSLSGPV